MSVSWANEDIQASSRRQKCDPQSESLWFAPQATKLHGKSLFSFLVPRVAESLSCTLKVRSGVR